MKIAKYPSKTLRNYSNGSNKGEEEKEEQRNYTHHNGVIVEQRTRPARGLKAAGARPGGARRRPHLAGLPCTCNTMRTSAVWPDAAGSHQDTPTNTTRRTLGLCKVNGKVTKNEEAWSHKEHQGTKEELEEQLWGLHHKASVAQS